jgi:pyruvate carboxylase subunit B
MKYLVTVGGRRFAVVVDGDHVEVDGRAVSARLEPVAGTPQIRLHLDGVPHGLAVDGRGEAGWRLVDHGSVRDVLAIDERTAHIRSLASTAGRANHGGIIRAPMPGLVTRIQVAPGDRVRAGQGVVVLEAMKMENELKAPADGVVDRIEASLGQPVDKGAVLVVLRGADG